MSFMDIDIKSCYESGVDDIVADFYDLALGESVSYDRIAGFFSSSSLAVASRGMARFIGNGGRMRLIASPMLNKADADIMERAVHDPQSLTAEELGLNLDRLEDEFTSNHVKALGWMLGEGLLAIKLAIVADNDGTPLSVQDIATRGIFHQKVGIMTDGDKNRLSFSGSVNESATAWVDNDEEFKVFKEWDAAKDYFEKDLSRFDALWNDRRTNVRVCDLPKAVKEKLVRYSKDFSIESISIEKYKSKRQANRKFSTSLSLFRYQNEALLKWEANGCCMLFEMATGTGKTRTAIAGMEYLMRKCQKLITVITTPQSTLSAQWATAIKELHIMVDQSVVIDGTNTKWVLDLRKILLSVSAGIANHIIIYTTHSTASSDKFRTIMDSNACHPILFVGDEVHWLGAAKLRAALLPYYQYRIGLSATPSRWFDDYGTKLLGDYFKNARYEFTLKDALSEINPLTGKHFLVNYCYHVRAASLDQDEARDYAELTSSISKLFKVKDKDADTASKYERLLERRANIVKNAHGKYAVMESILEELKANETLVNTIIFVSPQQLDTVMKILSDKDVVFHKLTQKEGSKKEARYNGLSEREHIIQKFKEKEYKVLVAMKCLDEGIDIPSASCGILMASSTNPREYVQRIGRIIRQDNSKTSALLYDICVNTNAFDSSYGGIESKIRSKEQLRMKEIAENALNAFEATQNILSIYEQ